MDNAVDIVPLHPTPTVISALTEALIASKPAPTCLAPSGPLTLPALSK
jgi:hypothetical protein